jgi:uncharacterized protein YoxC
MDNTDLHDATTVSDDGITVAHDFALTGSGIAVSIDLRSEREGQVMVHVVDGIPSELPVDTVAFRPGDEPDIGDASPERVSFRQRVGDTPVQVNYGIFLSEPAPDIRWERPEIRSVSLVDYAAAGPVVGSAGHEVTAGGSERFSQLEAELDRNVFGAPVRSSGRTLQPERAPRRVPDGDVERPAEETPTENADGATAAPRDSGTATDRSSTGNDTDGPESSPSRTDTGSGDGAKSEPPGPDSQQDESATDQADSGTSATATPADDGAGDRDTDEQVSDVPRSVEARIDHLSARIEEFAAFSTALQEVIDDHGSGVEIIDRFERELDEMATRVDAVQSDVESLRDDHEDDVASVHADVGSVRDDIERIDSRLDEHDADVSDVDESVQSLEESLSSVSADLQRTREEVTELREEVEELNDFRRSLADISNVDGT